MDDTKNSVNWLLYIVLALAIGFIFGFYFQYRKAGALKIELERFQRREAVIRQAEEDVKKNLAESALKPAQIKKAEQDVIKSLSAPNR